MYRPKWDPMKYSTAEMRRSVFVIDTDTQSAKKSSQNQDRTPNRNRKKQGLG